MLATYGHDDRGQLTSAEDSNSVLPDEAYQFDDNGNRELVDNNAGVDQDYVIDPNNRLASDGTYNYEYDDEGNRTRRTHIATGDSTVYTWDHRNRLTDVIDYDANGTPAYTLDDSFVHIIHYRYDVFNQLIYATHYTAGVGSEQTNFVYDGGQVALQFDRSPTGSNSAAGDLSHRYLWGPEVDQLLADEQVVSLEAEGEVLWAIADHLGSVRDVVDSNGDLRIHRQFDTFGNIVDEVHYDTDGEIVVSGPGYVTEAFAFTGRWRDPVTGLQNNLFRWYDPATGGWISEDPWGLGPDSNPNRYVRNMPTMFIDPHGLTAPVLTDPELQQGNKFFLQQRLNKRDYFDIIGGAITPPILDEIPENDEDFQAGMGNYFGLPGDFWRWYHKQVKDPGEPDVPSRAVAEELYREWLAEGKPEI